MMNVVNLKSYIKKKFQSLMRGHHVYKNVRSPYKGETLIAQPDN